MNEMNSHTEDGIFKLKGKILHYAWGGAQYLPELLGISNPDGKPFAEYWMGAHPLAPAELVTPNGRLSLVEGILSNPTAFLSERVYQQFGELPYLFKVQDVKEVLSIQVHPSKTEAEIGFEREDAAGIPRDAPHRNYKDRNHKPEVMVALSEFWLLHGFRSKQAIEKLLANTPEFQLLLPLFKRDGYRGLYQVIMELDQKDIDSLLLNLVKRELRRKQEGLLTKTDPGWWVAKFFEGKEEIGTIDRGICSMYFFNIVQVQPGEAVFQAAGIPHAYLEGQTMELMANSDNVLRGGLTPKHMDVPELMKHIVFEEVVPVVLSGQEILPGEKMYPCPVPDFGISKIELTEHLTYSNHSDSLEMIIVISGGALIGSSTVLKKGETAAILPGRSYKIQCSGNTLLFRAFVPNP